MVKVPFEGKIDSYQGKSLATPIEFKGEADNYENVTEAKTAGVWPNDAEILETLNTKLVTSAKAKEYQKSTKDLKEAYEASSDFKRAQLVKAAVAAGFSQAEAEALAASKLS